MHSLDSLFNIKLSWILFILLFLIIPPPFLTSIFILERLNAIIIVFLFISVLLLSVLKGKLNLFVLMSILFLGWKSLSSYLLADGLLDISNNLRILSLILLINLTAGKHALSIIKALFILFSCYIILNFISFVLFPNGIYLDNPRPGEYREAWFLGTQNQFSLIIIPGITVVIFYSWFVFNKISLYAWVNIVIAGITVFIADSATTKIAFFFIIISILLNLGKNIKIVYNFLLLASGYAVIWIFLVRLKAIDMFQSIITSLFNKDMTLSGRIDIWDEILELIPESLVYGFGNNTRVVAYDVTEFRAHNIFLQILLDNGLIGLILMITCILISGFMLQKNKHNMLAVILLIGLFGILIGGLAEAYRLNNLFMILTLSYFSGIFITRNKERYNRYHSI